MAFDLETPVLGKAPAFRGLPPDKLRLIAYFGARMIYEPGEIVFCQGDASDAMFIVLDGVVALSVAAPHGSPRHLVDYKCGDLLGEAGVLSGRARVVSAAARTRATLLRIAREDFFSMLREVPQIGEAIMRDLAHRLELLVIHYAEVTA